jgi:predicted AlkP superfamily phosphohydrolase/phosphomutase
MFRSVRSIPLLALGSALAFALSAEGLSRAVGAPTWKESTDARTRGRFVVLGFDGVDPRVLEEYARAGDLPEISALFARGGLHRLQSEIPPESPVAWSSMLTGVNPGRHRVTDFVIREPAKTGYAPVNGMASITPPRFLAGRIPVRPPVVAGRLAYPTFLERVAKAGVPVLALRQPLLFPAAPMPGGRALSGLGTPDVAGSNGLYAIYRTGLGLEREYTVFDGHRIHLEGPADARSFDTYLEGPFDPTGRSEDGGRRRLTVPLRFERGGHDQPVTVTVAGQRVRVGVGERTTWLSVRFTVPSWPPRRVSGRARFEVKSADPLVVLSDPVQIDPMDPALPLSSPPEYAADLERRYGPYKTTGWMEQTFQLNDQSTSEEAFLKDLLEDMDHGAAVLRGEIRRGGRCVFYVFTQTDRAAHCFWWRRDGPSHPAYDARAAARLVDPLRDVYRRMDRIVGDVAEALDRDDVLLVVSDHGFQSWKRGMNVNQWLMDEGYLVAADQDERTLHEFFGDRLKISVDWSRTRAYALGLGQVYLNRVGREPSGVVSDAEAGPLLDEIERRLLALRDRSPGDREGEGVAPVSRVYRLKDLYSGPYAHEAGDLQLAFGPGYRISWQTALLGGMKRGGAVFEDNDKSWSGDHCSTDRDLVPGILLSNRPIPPADPKRPYHVRDVAATALAHFGLDGTDLEAAPLPVGRAR